MKFDSRPYTIVKSVAQRGLLKWWNDPLRGRLPGRVDCDAEELRTLWPEMALHVVERVDGRIRFKCQHHGPRQQQIDGGSLAGCYLDEFFPEPIKAGALAAYEATVTMRCPIYTVRNAIDVHQVPVAFERIRLPLSDGDGQVDYLLTHVEIFCEDGRYQRENLLHAGIALHGYAVTAAITMAAVGLSPGAQVLDS